MAPAARAASWSFLTLGTVATQRGRAVQPDFIISRMRRAVVLPSSVTGLSSGTGGVFTVAHSVMMSAVWAGIVPRHAMDNVNARVRYRDRVRVFFMMFPPCSRQILTL